MGLGPPPSTHSCSQDVVATSIPKINVLQGQLVLRKGFSDEPLVVQFMSAHDKHFLALTSSLAAS